MSHFYGSVQGNRGAVTRGGSKQSGYSSVAASWEGSVVVELWHNPEQNGGEDWVEVFLTPWQGKGKRILLYRGPVSGRDFEQYKSE